MSGVAVQDVWSGWRARATVEDGRKIVPMRKYDSCQQHELPGCSRTPETLNLSS